MYIKVEPDSFAGTVFQLIWLDIQDCIAARSAFLKLVNATQFVPPRISRVGGVAAIAFDTPPASGWKRVMKAYFNNAYYPTADNKEVLEAIQALPVIDSAQLNDCMKFNPQFTDTGYMESLNIKFSKAGVAYINKPTHIKYKLLEGMVEVTETEFLSATNNSK